MSKRARAWWLTIGLLLLASTNASAGPGGFTFTPPAGWVDISRGAPEAQRAKATPALRAQADNPVITFMAMDPEHWDDGFVENMNVVVQTGKRALPSTPEVLAEVAKAAEAQATKAGLTYRTTKMEVVKVAGVSAGRLEAELKSPAVATKLVQYVIPGEMSEAMLTFTTTPTNFARYAPLFDASAQATVGAVEPQTRSMRDSAQLGAIAGAIGGAVGALLVVRSKRRRQLAQRRQQPPSAPGSGPG
jgi:hypothetical protein